MRRTKEQTAESKSRILSTAARLLRERGVEGVSIADVMEAAGMTQGGFYRHFSSKNDLLAAATRYAFDSITQLYDVTRDAAGSEAALRDYVETYVSKAHIDHPGLGCPMAAFGSDAGRITDVLGPEFNRGAASLIDRVSTSLAETPNGSGKPARAVAIEKLLLMVGTVVVARVLNEEGLRNEVLSAARSYLETN